MATLTQASTQWATRPDDQRFTSLDDLLAFTSAQRRDSRSLAVSSRRIEARPIAVDEGKFARELVVMGPDGAATSPTHWAFGQLAARVKAPAGYLRSLPADLTADCINHGLAHRDVEDVGALLRIDSGGPLPELAALTGPNYGRVWNSDVVGALQSKFGDGVTGDWTVPGEFGHAVDVTKANTTLFASDRDMFVFLADEKHRIEVPNRRAGKPGSLARGFFVWNSEVGSTTLGIATFLFDYVCCNRMVWGAEGFQELRVRHTVSAPDKFLEQVQPALVAYSNSRATGVQDAIAQAQAARIGDKDEVMEFLVKRRRFSQTQAAAINLAHVAEEGRPIETLWDATVGVTAYAKGMKHQDARVDLERKGGELLTLASK
jgi:hypothetical protein